MVEPDQDSEGNPYWAIHAEQGYEFILNADSLANARLIAASPDLLEALKQMRATALYISPACIDAADKAIAKAEGKQP
jgi:hypothetical protein